MSRLIGRRRDKVFSSEYFDFNFEHFVVLQVSEQADRQEQERDKVKRERWIRACSWPPVESSFNSSSS